MIEERDAHGLVWADAGDRVGHRRGPRSGGYATRARVRRCDTRRMGGGAPVWLVIGAQGAGKSSVADALARSFDRGVRVRGGQFYRWAVRGWLHVGQEPELEVRRLLDLRYDLSAQVADRYAEAGFTTVAQDNIYGPDVVRWLRRVVARPRHLVVLRPSVEVVRRRDAARRRATGKVAYRPGEVTVEELDAALGRTDPIGLWLDTSDQTVDETLREVLSRQHEAAVDDVLG